MRDQERAGRGPVLVPHKSYISVLVCAKIMLDSGTQSPIEKDCLGT